MAFIVITLFLDVLGLGLIIPVLPVLVTSFSGGDPSEAALYYGLLISSYAALQFIFAPILGSLSDRFGRRPVILIALFGFGINYLLLALAPSLVWIFVARLTSGIFGASFTAANAYIADISTSKNRAQNFGLVGVAFGLGFICGPALGGLLGHLGPRVPFFVAAVVVLVNWLYGLLVLPESLPVERRRPFSLRDANPFGGLARLRRYPFVLGLAVALVFLSLSQRGLESVWVLYTNYRYGWDELENGLTLGLFGVMAALVQGLLIRRVIPRLGERRTVILGLMVSLCGSVAYGLSYRPALLFVVIVVASVGGLAQPAIQGLVAGSVDPSEQGSIQGALTSLISLTAIVAPLISTQLFGTFTGEGALLEIPGMPFFSGALFLSIALFLIERLFRKFPPPSPGARVDEGVPDRG